MSEAEARAFEADPLFKDMIQVRKLDEVAKVRNLEVAPIEAYVPMIERACGTSVIVASASCSHADIA